MKEISNKEYVRLYQEVLDYLNKNLDMSRFSVSWNECFERLIPKPTNSIDQTKHSIVRKYSGRSFKASVYWLAILEIIAYRYSRESDVKIWYTPKRSIEIIKGGVYLEKKERNR
jgi:hypothetical protein